MRSAHGRTFTQIRSLRERARMNAREAARVKIIRTKEELDNLTFLYEDDG